MNTAAAHDHFAEALAGATTPSAYLDAAHRAVVHAATLAPSVHNSQPWRFTKDEGGVDMYADDARRLRVLDPAGRLVQLSCGAALHHAQVAACGLGFHVDLQLLPDPADPAHLARMHLTAGAPPSPRAHALASAILHRHTHRAVFEDRVLPSDLLDRLRLAAEEQHAAIASITGDDLVELEVLLAWADALEEGDPAYRAELHDVVRSSPSQDGIPQSALPSDPERGSSLRLRDFALVGSRAHDDDPPAAEKPAVALLVTDDDSPRSWLQAGQALSAVLLTAAVDGVMGQPLAQVTDFPAARVKLRHALGLVGTPQMALRLGYASSSGMTQRRDVDDVLTDADAPGSGSHT